MGKTSELSQLHHVAGRPEHDIDEAEENEKLNNGGTGADKLLKVLVVGDIATGKTSIIGRYAYGTFLQRYKPTIGVDFAWKPLKWNDGTLIRLQLWDIAGQERFNNMTRVYYKEAVGAVVVFDVNRLPTYESTAKWKSEIDSRVCFPNTDDPIPVILVGNKIDLKENGFGVSKAEMDDFCEENGFVKFFETSAKENTNIEEAIHFLVDKILSKMKTVPPKPTEEEEEDPPIRIRDPDEEEEEEKTPVSTPTQSGTDGGCKC